MQLNDQVTYAGRKWQIYLIYTSATNKRRVKLQRWNTDHYVYKTADYDLVAAINE